MTTKTPSRIPPSLEQISISKLFQIWQDLANEATGHDTEWDYPIFLDRIAQELKTTKHRLIQQLAQHPIPSLELLAKDNALTFRYPV
ncbi:MAG TPA: hypothetical protein V6C65_11185 [Allocoleopsis sp.]